MVEHTATAFNPLHNSSTLEFHWHSNSKANDTVGQGATYLPNSTNTKFGQSKKKRDWTGKAKQILLTCVQFGAHNPSLCPANHKFYSLCANANADFLGKQARLFAIAEI